MADKGPAALLLKNRISPKSEPPTPPRSPNSAFAVRTNAVPNSIATQTVKGKTDVQFLKQQIGSRVQSSLLSTTGVSVS